MSEKWLIIGISGVTCGGKTTLSTELNKLIPHSIVISQDDYFLHVDDPKHTWIPELDHINFDIVSSLDMEKMYTDILNLVKTSENGRSDVTNSVKTKSDLAKYADASDLQKEVCSKVEERRTKVLIVEGFCIFNYKPVSDLCYLRYYFTLTRDECYKRRITRIYEPPDCPGYFEKCVWPEYINLFDEVKTNVKNMKYFDGTLKPPLQEVLIDILNAL